MPRAVVAFLVASLALPTAAQAQGPGVFVDPDSPAGTEYAIPLEEARRHGAPGAEPRPGGGNADPPLFGEGITRAPGASAAEGGSARSGGGSAGAAGGSEGTGGKGGRGGDRGAAKAADGEVLGAQETERSHRGSVAVEAAAQGGSDALLTAGIAGTVLAVGLLVGFGLRRVLRNE
jgi:hypothetical protein